MTIGDAVDTFDFAKVKRVMDHLNWLWVGNATPPSVADMQAHVFHLARSIGSSKLIRSGGFTVRHLQHPTTHEEYWGIEFVVARSLFDASYYEE